MDLSSLKPAEGSKIKRKRIGRGQGSKRGGTSTRGHNGAQSRSGYSIKRGFEGGQMPLFRRIPKFGFKNINRVEYSVLNLDFISQLIEKFKTDVIDLAFMRKHHLISKNDKIKVLARGTIESAVKVSAHSFSDKAKKMIEEKGGEATLIE